MNANRQKDLSPVTVNEELLFSIIQDFEDLELWCEHIHRYVFIKPYCCGKRVLDLAAGEGSGCNFLASDAAQVIGLGQDGRAITSARNRYIRENLSFLKASAFSIPFKRVEPFDVIIGFDIHDYTLDLGWLVDDVQDLLSDCGLFFVSVLNNNRYLPWPESSKTDSENNCVLDELLPLLQSRFSYVQVFAQEYNRVSSISPVYEKLSVNDRKAYIAINEGDIVLCEDRTPHPFFFIVLATNCKVPDLYSSQIIQVSDISKISPYYIQKDDPEIVRLMHIIHYLTMDVIHLYRYSVLLKEQIAQLNTNITELQSTISYSFNRFLDRSFPENTVIRRLIRHYSKILRRLNESDRKIPFLNIPGLRFPVNRGRHRQRLLIRNTGEMKERKNRPVISLILDGDTKNPMLLNRSITSVGAQNCPDWELLVVYQGEEGFPIIQDQRVRRITPPFNLPIDATPVRTAVTGTHLGFIKAGDTLDSQSIQKIIEYLQESPDTDVLYTDELRVDMDDKPISEIYRPDYSEDFLLSSGYISHLVIVKKELIPWDIIPSFDPVHLPMIFLRAKKVGHIAIPLYRSYDNNETKTNERMQVVSRYLKEKGIDADVTETNTKGVIRIKRKISGVPKVTIIIPTRDQTTILKRCIDSIENKSTYNNYEVIIVNNQSNNSESLQYLHDLEKSDAKYRVLDYPFEFNYSLVNNFAAGFASGDHLLFLNNDIEVVSSDWIEALLEHSQRAEVACVGAKLLYPDGTIQHAGVVIGLFGGADHVGKYLPGDYPGYLNAFVSIRDYSAVTSACMMIARDKFWKLGGFDRNFIIGFGDTDLCLRAISSGYRNIFTPYAQLYHHESFTRGASPDKDPHPGDTFLLQHRWQVYMEYGDPFYNPNLPVDSYDCQP